MKFFQIKYNILLTAALLLLIFHGAVIPLNAEILFLKSGKVLYGKLISETDEMIKFKTESGTTDFGRNIILRMLYKNGPLYKMYIYLKDSKKYRGYIVDEDAGKIVIREDLQKNVEIPIKRAEIKIVSEKEIKKSSLPYTFKLKREASFVSIEGDFTGWRPMDMVKNGKGWERKIDIDILKKNDYQFRFIVDGKADEKNRKIKFKVDGARLMEDIDLLRPKLGIGVGTALAGFDKVSGGLDINFPIFALELNVNNPYFMNKSSGAGIFLGYFATEKVLQDTLRNITFTFTTTNIPLLLNFFFSAELSSLNLELRPKFGIGAVFQNTVTKGGGQEGKSFRTSASAEAGLNIIYSINDTQEIMLNYTFLMVMDKSLIQYNMLMLGIGYRI